MAQRTLWERGAVALNGVASGVFGSLSALRGKRFFHPDGDAYEATATFLDADDVDELARFLAGATSPALVRFSRGIGLPQAAPDVLGMAVKLVDFVGPREDQDFLFVTSGEGAVLQNTLRPARGFFRGNYSTVLPYRGSLSPSDGASGDVGASAVEPGQGRHGLDLPGGRSSRRPTPQTPSEQILFGARPDPELEGSADATFHDVAAAAAVGRLRFELMSARIGDPWRRLGSLVVTSKLDAERAEALRFNPWNCHPDLDPAGPLNEWRRSAYVKSQEARPGG